MPDHFDHAFSSHLAGLGYCNRMLFAIHWHSNAEIYLVAWIERPASTPQVRVGEIFGVIGRSGGNGFQGLSARQTGAEPVMSMASTCGNNVSMFFCFIDT